MNTVTPQYYRAFACIKGACKHSCCVGWEIDIDKETLALYRTVPAPFGERLCRHIATDDIPHFVLDKKERCPFLNSEGLCDIILTLGDEALCDICAEHPRFHNELSDRIEIGLGLACEAAGRLILRQTEPMTLVGAEPSEEPIVQQRDSLLTILQDRARPLAERLSDLLVACDCAPPHTDMGQWADTLLQLERLDEEWARRLHELQARWQCIDLAAFDRAMVGRETEYEQLAVYLLYRHFVSAETKEEVAGRAQFVAFGVMLLYYLGAVQFEKSGAFTLDDQVELARLFSSEIEYSDENLSFFWET